MRVTKTIREYIEEQVAKKFPTTDNNHPYMITCKKFEGLAEERTKSIRKYIENELADLISLYQDEMPDGWTFKDFSNTSFIRLIGHETYGTSPLKDEYRRWQNAQREKQRKAIQDIIITLELGGNKADLEKMLGELSA